MVKRQIYNSLTGLSKIFHIYYQNMSKVDREVKGKSVEEQITKLLILSSDSYFTDSQPEIVKNIHRLDFMLRDLFVCKIISSRQQITLERFISKMLEDFDA